MFPKSWISFMIFLWWLKALATRVEGAEVGWTQSSFSPQLLHVGKLGCSSPDLDLFFSLHITFFPSPQHKPTSGSLRRMVKISQQGVSPTLSEDPSLPCWSAADCVPWRKDWIMTAPFPGATPFLDLGSATHDVLSLSFPGPGSELLSCPIPYSLASFCLFPGTWSISTPSFSLSRQNFIHIW